MAEHDYVIANQNGANTRSDLNNALAAIVSNNSKATAPTTTYAFMLWADTANDILKQRNAADSAWISILTLSTGAPLGTIANFTSTGIDDNATSTAITIDSAEHVSLAHGIGFNGDTAAANALDDYEEGTWTPTFFGSSGTIGAYAATTTGLYTKIGRKVTCTGVIRLSNIGSWAGNAMISGLPFAPTTSEFIASMQTGGVTFTGVTSLYGYTGVTSLNLKESTSGGAISNVAVTSCASTSQFLFTVQYFTA
jgi:hypothetical protein